jgi:hypothetical protein
VRAPWNRAGVLGRVSHFSARALISLRAAHIATGCCAHICSAEHNTAASNCPWKTVQVRCHNDAAAEDWGWLSHCVQHKVGTGHGWCTHSALGEPHATRHRYRDRICSLNSIHVLVAIVRSFLLSPESVAAWAAAIRHPVMRLLSVPHAALTPVCLHFRDHCMALGGYPCDRQRHGERPGFSPRQHTCEQVRDDRAPSLQRWPHDSKQSAVVSRERAPTRAQAAHPGVSRFSMAPDAGPGTAGLTEEERERLKRAYR